MSFCSKCLLFQSGRLIDHIRPLNSYVWLIRFSEHKNRQNFLGQILALFAPTYRIDIQNLQKLSLALVNANQ